MRYSQITRIFAERTGDGKHTRNAIRSGISSSTIQHASVRQTEAFQRVDGEATLTKS
jgi:hypothetical protein